MKAELMEVTPALALSWLDLNTDNRNISDSWVQAIAADILAGKWDPNNATIGIRVNDKGEPKLVVDGQHRLWAINSSGKSVWTWVVFGDETLRRDNIDRVKPRSVADQLLLLDGVKDAKRISSICSVLQTLEKGSVDQSVMTLEMARAIKARYSDALDWAMSVMYTTTSAVRSRQHLQKAGVAGVMVYAYATAPDKIDLFAKQVRDGENITRQDPAYALRTFLERAYEAHATVNRSTRHEIITMTLRACMAAIKGEKLSALKPGAIMGGTFYRDACKFFSRAQQRREKKTG